MRLLATRGPDTCLYGCDCDLEGPSLLRGIKGVLPTRLLSFVTPQSWVGLFLEDVGYGRGDTAIKGEEAQ